MSRALVVTLLIPMLAFSPGIVQIAYSQEPDQDLMADDDGQASDASGSTAEEPIVEPAMTFPNHMAPSSRVSRAPRFSRSNPINQVSLDTAERK